jgi:uncharacterized protein (DUF697 family)
MATKLEAKTMTALLSALHWVYDKAIEGVPGLDSAGALAASYQAQFPSSELAIEALVRWQIAKAAAAGFLTNIGGVASLPIALPANLVSALYIQVRMVAAIAALRGHDLRSDQVRAIVLGCLCGTTLVDVAKEAVIGIGTGLAQQAAASLSTAALQRARHAGGLEVVRKAVSRVPLNLSRLTPLIGGLIAGALDGALTRSYATVAKRLFAPLVTLEAA